ncbi:hypothetical protein HPB50_011818 [Hyalomma asiaticum]|uniref:Uncharacterized protein n=1 Tax=Hyalomma asiaticum TaxID=266040 RepID=A0ACB7RTE8_HYAAI|nr:hypothetical protein HPB50_011818 [Hyalomma asiaticum]
MSRLVSSAVTKVTLLEALQFDAEELQELLKFRSLLSAVLSNSQLILHKICELIEAATVSQYQRLLRTQTGRRILERLGFEPQACFKQTGKVPPRVRDRLRLLPLPKNMHPVHHEGRRKDRAEALQKSLEGREDVIYTDAAEYKQGKILGSMTRTTSRFQRDEVVAVVLPLVGKVDGAAKGDGTVTIIVAKMLPALQKAEANHAKNLQVHLLQIHLVDKLKVADESERDDPSLSEERDLAPSRS